MADVVSLSLRSKLESLETVSAAVKRLARESGFSDDSAEQIELATWEAVANAIRHGNRGCDGKWVEVKLVAERKRIEIFVRDSGAGFDLTSLRDPRTPDRLFEPSARGIFLMRALMDEVEYSTHPCGGTVVRMSKGG